MSIEVIHMPASVARVDVSRLEGTGDMTLVLDYWDCNCESEYIHSNNHSQCLKCKANMEDQPNSRLGELKEFGFNTLGFMRRSKG